jgi:hypothetical protein
MERNLEVNLSSRAAREASTLPSTEKIALPFHIVDRLSRRHFSSEQTPS